MSPAQCRAARALLNWSQERLAWEASLSVSALRNFERGASVPVPNNLAALRRALEAEGVEITDGNAPGVRLRPAEAPEREDER